LCHLKLNTMKRAKFIKQASAMMLLGVPLLSVTNGCYNNTQEPTPTPPVQGADCLANGTSTNIAANHGHTLTVSKADVANAVDKTYAIKGSASHNHDVTITAANFTSLKSNNSIQVSSTTDNGHTHNVTVSCA
jgi:hypothetical protein